MTTANNLMQFLISASGLTDIGRRRQNNEDAFLIDPEHGVFAVADGMGGYQGGEVASAMAIEGLRKRLTSIPATHAPGEPTLEHRRQQAERLLRAVDEVNAEIYARAQANSQLRGMGCTLDVMLARDRGVFLAHVGDSRVYGLRDGLLYQITEDHSFGQAMRSSGGMTEEEIQAHPQRDRLMRALGVYPNVQIDTAYLDVTKDDIYMLCSDGVHGSVSVEQIGRAMAAGPVLGAQALIKLALAAGGPDNATAVVFKIDSQQSVASVRVGSEEVRRAMAQASLFDGFTDNELLRVQKIADGRVLQPGEVVIRSHEVCRELYLVLSGALSGWREEHRVATLGPGDPFGEMSFHEDVSLATIRADSPAQILVFPLQELRQLLKKDNALAAKLTMNSLQRVSKRFKQLAAVADRLRSANG